ncbi:DUF3846 domain-containing protein [Sinorhizobium fredii]|uniref:DUF3846 domain-containing protein n=1 Tax=Rhizobium fredii TaxID=380 RepID=UPI001F0A4F05|nr:hypothetical protein [Sinorhizobium fredii]
MLHSEKPPDVRFTPLFDPVTDAFCWVTPFMTMEKGWDMKNVAYLLDPETTLFRTVEVADGTGLAPIFSLLGCRLVQMIRFDDSHALFLDDEGLRDGITAFTVFASYPQPLGGRIVLIRGDGSEPHFSPSIKIEDAAVHFKCCRPVLDPVFVTADDATPKGLILPGALSDLKVRIEQRPPMLMDGRHDVYRAHGDGLNS